jgi:hypothetical protein
LNTWSIWLSRLYNTMSWTIEMLWLTMFIYSNKYTNMNTNIHLRCFNINTILQLEFIIMMYDHYMLEWKDINMESYCVDKMNNAPPSPLCGTQWSSFTGICINHYNMIGEICWEWLYNSVWSWNLYSKSWMGPYLR